MTDRNPCYAWVEHPVRTPKATSTPLPEAGGPPLPVPPSRRGTWWTAHLSEVLLGLLAERGVDAAWLRTDEIATALDASIEGGFPNPRGIRQVIGHHLGRLGVARGPGERRRRETAQPNGTRCRLWVYLVRKAALLGGGTGT